jgi:hypothetical protein
MPKRFSGEVRLTINRRIHDDYDIKVKAPGCAPYEGVTSLDSGYTNLHGEQDAMDEAGSRHLSYLSKHNPALTKHAAKDGDRFYVGRTKAERWPGGTSDTKTKKGR